VRVATQYAPPAVRRTLRPSSSPPRAQRALLPIAVGAMNINELMNDVRKSAAIFPRPCKLTFDLLTLKVVLVSRVTWATCVPILVFLGLSVLELFPMYAIQTSDRRQTKASLYAPPRGWGIIIAACINLLLPLLNYGAALSCKVRASAQTVLWKLAFLHSHSRNDKQYEWKVNDSSKHNSTHFDASEVFIQLPLMPLEICMRVKSMFWAQKSHSFIQNWYWITLQVSHHQGWKTCVEMEGKKVKLIFRYTLMTWHDWSWPHISRHWNRTQFLMIPYSKTV